ncbi:DUF4157 domain-containing protein [Arthrobacter deserti]|uniref:DUF4157 domain-containing protein n=1 Tax=Arthrobacter deserti TaxID=1742687 RepID=A0ABX1JK82_9MICC|nr:DUF4157 domain-containing protein [Arthrobacter deserti]
MTVRERLRRMLYWLNLSTPLGLAVAAPAGCRTGPGPHGLFIAHGYRPALPKAAAFTIGNVVLFRPAAAALAADSVLLGHEARHSTQYASCLGLPFLPLYGLAALWSLWRTGDPASRNFFERRAGLLAGGYTERPVRRPVRGAGRRTGSR